MARRTERQAQKMAKELGRLVARVERQARQAARRGRQMQAAARKRSVKLLRRGAWALDRLALQLEKSGRKSRAKRRR